MRGSSSTMPPGALPAEEHVLDDVEVVAEREVLVHDLDAESGGVAGAVDRDRLAVEEVLARVDRVDAADALDERRLAGAVVADERGHLAGPVDVEVDVVEHLHRAEALVDARAVPAGVWRSRAVAPVKRWSTRDQGHPANPGGARSARRRDGRLSRSVRDSADAGSGALGGVGAGAQVGLGDVAVGDDVLDVGLVDRLRAWPGPTGRPCSGLVSLTVRWSAGFWPLASAMASVRRRRRPPS